MAEEVKVIDLEVETVAGETVRVSDLMEGKRTVLVALRRFG